MKLQLDGRLGNILFMLAYGISNNASFYIQQSQFNIIFNIRKYFQYFNIPITTTSKHSTFYYRQSEEIFDIDLIRKLFIFKNNQYFNNLIDHNSVGIHVRRGDYNALQQMFRVLSSTYYEDTYYKFFNGLQVYIASDDIQWCKENIHIPHAIFIDEFTKNEFETLYCLSRCKHHIGSCSTFSWWGSWINEQHDAINIYPNQWFNNVTNLDDIALYIHNNIIPNRWITIDAY